MYSENKSNKHRQRNNTFENDRRTKMEDGAEQRFGLVMKIFMTELGNRNRI